MGRRRQIVIASREEPDHVIATPRHRPYIRRAQTNIRDATRAAATRPGIDARETPQPDPQQPIERLLFVADAAVAGADELPPQVRAIIDAAAEVYVVTPSPAGAARLARR